MTVKERVLTARLALKIEKHRDCAKQLGLCYSYTKPMADNDDSKENERKKGE